MLLSFRPVNCCPAHFGFVYPPSRQLAEGERLVFSLLKSVGSENRQERKITEERGRGGDGGKKALVLDSRLSRSRYLSETNGRNCERAENEKGESCGNCLSLPQSGIALETISSSCCCPSKNRCPREFQISFAEAETTAVAAVAGNFPWQSLQSLPSHPPSPVLSLSLVPMWR